MSPSRLRFHESLLLKHSGTLEQTDKWISLLTAVVPGESATVELGIESAISAVALLNIYKKQVLMRLVKESNKPLISRYLQAQFDAHKSYKLMSYLLSIVKSTELLMEMSVARFKGEKNRWKTVLGVESFKAVLRLSMLFVSKRVIPSAAPVHNEDATPEEINALMIPKIDNLEKSERYNGPLKRELNVPTKENLTPPINYLRKSDIKLTTSEILSILRPLVYATLLYKYRNRRKSWTPWVIGLAMEYISREIARSAIQSSSKISTKLENEVYGERDRDLLSWLLRGPMYEQNVRQIGLKVKSLLSKIPLLNLSSLFIDDYLYYLDNFYFSSSTL